MLLLGKTQKHMGDLPPTVSDLPPPTPIVATSLVIIITILILLLFSGDKLVGNDRKLSHKVATIS